MDWLVLCVCFETNRTPHKHTINKTWHTDMDTQVADTCGADPVRSHSHVSEPCCQRHAVASFDSDAVTREIFCFSRSSGSFKHPGNKFLSLQTASHYNPRPQDCSAKPAPAHFTGFHCFLFSLLARTDHDPTTNSVS